MDDDDFDPEAEDFLAAAPGEPAEQEVAVAADRLLREYGRDAPTIAGMWAADWLARGEYVEYRLSKRIQMAVDELLTMASPSGR